MFDLTNAVVSRDGKAVADSRDVARFFEKEHKNVLATVREITDSAPDLVGLNFQPYSYIAENGKQNPCYLMDRDGFSLLAMGFTGEKALQFKIAFIKAFNEMEAQLRRPQTMMEMIHEISGKMVENERKIREQEEKASRLECELAETVSTIAGMQTSQEVLKVFVEQKMADMQAKLPNQDEQYYAILGYANLMSVQIDRDMGKKLGRACTAHCRHTGLEKKYVTDEHFGKIGLYPKSILETVFKAHSLI